MNGSPKIVAYRLSPVFESSTSFGRATNAPIVCCATGDTLTKRGGGEAAQFLAPDVVEAFKDGKLREVFRD